MIWKPVVTLALMALLLPREPDIGLGRPAAFSQIEIERAHTALFDAIDRVRADLKANERS